jgi:membrane protein insertase Oxa1/YidC/SpoIIIJ
MSCEKIVDFLNSLHVIIFAAQIAVFLAQVTDLMYNFFGKHISKIMASTLVVNILITRFAPKFYQAGKIIHKCPKFQGHAYIVQTKV